MQKQPLWLGNRNSSTVASGKAPARAQRPVTSTTHSRAPQPHRKALLAPTRLGLLTGAFSLPPRFQKRDLNIESESKAQSTGPHVPFPFIVRGLEKDPLRDAILFDDGEV